MKTRLLDGTEFKATIVEPMCDVLEIATDVIDIWTYVEAIPTHELCGNSILDGCVEHVYRNGNHTFDHVVVVTMTKNVFLVVVVDLQRDSIYGHHLLDLNHEYGLATRH